MHKAKALEVRLPNDNDDKFSNGSYKLREISIEERK